MSLRRGAKQAPLERWCERAGQFPIPGSYQALARGVGLPRQTVWATVSGRELATLTTVSVMARELRLDMGDVARAFLGAREDWEQQQDVERVRLEAEGEG